MNSVVQTGLYVGSTWTDGEGSPIPVVNPATADVVASVASASDSQVDAAVASARMAFPEWSRRSSVERGALLRQMAAAIAEHVDTLAPLLTEEMGKPLAQARMEVMITSAYITYVAEWDRRIEGDIIESDAPGEVINLIRAPLGVVAAICPWNAPLAVFARKVSPALLTGNTVVVKPSEVSPLSTIALVELIAEAVGLPPGVLNLVTGGAAVGSALVTHHDVDMVTMTGHRDTGRKIMELAAGDLTRVSLELGGKAPLIVWQDADLEAAVTAAVAARHANSGQVCNCAERIFVHRDVADAFTRAYVEGVAALRLGDPSADVDLGPLASGAQFDKAVTAVAAAVAAGATEALRGGRPEGSEFQRGNWFAPVVLTDVTPEMEVMREETFAPITPIMAVDSFDEVVKYANDSRYGLSAYLFTNDYRLVMRASRELECGELFVNRSIGESLQGHHIGHKQSGLGGEDGKYGLLKYTQLRSVYHHYA